MKFLFGEAGYNDRRLWKDLRQQSSRNCQVADVNEDDEIIFSKYGGTEIKVGTDEVLILRESDVLAKVIGDRELAGAKS